MSSVYSVCGLAMEELQRECRKLLQHEDQLRAQHRHELAIRRQIEEQNQRQIEENRHIIARYATLFYSVSNHGRCVCF